MLKPFWLKQWAQSGGRPSNSLRPVVTPYLTTVLNHATKTPLPIRSQRELRTLALAIDSLLTEFLAIAKESKQKYDLKSREDINGYSGATPVLYNKFLFRAG